MKCNIAVISIYLCVTFEVTAINCARNCAINNCAIVTNLGSGEMVEVVCGACVAVVSCWRV